MDERRGVGMRVGQDRDARRSAMLGVAPCVALALLASPLVAQVTKLKDIGPFLMDRAQEIELARSAGPRGIGEAATVLVLTRTGYEVAQEGTNGFACFVGRGWSGPGATTEDGRRIADPDVLNPRLLAPHCFNPAAAESVLPWHCLMTEALIGGTSVEDLPKVTALALQQGKLKAPGPEAFAYMTSSHQHLGERFGNWRPHVMLYLPYASNVEWGAAGFDNDYPFVTEAGTAWSIVVIPIARFSDGSAPRPLVGRDMP